MPRYDQEGWTRVSCDFPGLLSKVGNMASAFSRYSIVIASHEHPAVDEAEDVDSVRGGDIAPLQWSRLNSEAERADDEAKRQGALLLQWSRLNSEAEGTGSRKQ